VDSKDPDLELYGLISVPSVTYSDKGLQEFFVNGRAIRNPSLSHAVALAYQDLIPAGRHPSVFLFVRMPLEGVDVNVHPTKREVRFREPSRLHGCTVEAIRTALSGNGGRGADGGFKIPPSPPFSKGGAEDRVQETASVYRGTDAFTSGVPQSSTHNPISEPRNPLLQDVHILGQIHQLYILAEVEGELQMIDQHAAHERILYDRLRAQYRKAAVEVQRLLFPERLSLSPEEASALEEARPLFDHIGCDLEPFGGETFLLRSVPAVLSGEDWPRLIRDILSEWRQSERVMGMDDLLMDLTGRRACRRAVRGGMSLSEEAVRALVAQWRETEMPYTCPHGRPAVWKISLAEIEKRFGRR
jgi:DNA mismatch repair protein MutL